jgi:predicted acylesterase/phospholipase RssA
MAVRVPSIQVAFQGGGARFIEMLPIAAALHKAHSDGTVNITRVAGSSAGSICAALIACNADFDLACDFIRSEGPPRAELMRRWSSDLGDDSPVTNRLKLIVALWRAYRGKQLLRSEVLVTFLNDLFAKAAPAAPKQIEDINENGGIQLAITGSDLSQSRGVTFESGNLIERILHSAAIPFAFRNFPDISTSPYVDGGLCENLPVEQLLIREDLDGPVFCVTIADEAHQAYAAKSFKEYCLQLISASMNHNVDRSKRLVGLSNQFEEKSNLSTFEFERAISKLNDANWYKNSFDRTMGKLHKISQLYEMVGSPAPSKLSGRLSASKIMHSLFKVFETSLGIPEWEYVKSEFVVRAECLHSPQPNQNRSVDFIIRTATIKAMGDNLVCFNSSAHLNAESSIIPTAWTCFNATQNREIAVQAIPVRNPADPSVRLVGVLVFFENPHQSVAKGDTLIIKSHFLLDDAMTGLHKAGADYISVENGHAIGIGVAEAVLVYPSTFGTISPVGSGGTEIPIPAAILKEQHLANLPNELVPLV